MHCGWIATAPSMKASQLFRTTSEDAAAPTLARASEGTSLYITTEWPWSGPIAAGVALIRTALLPSDFKAAETATKSRLLIVR